MIILDSCSARAGQSWLTKTGVNLKSTESTFQRVPWQAGVRLVLCASQVHEAVLRITSNPLYWYVHTVCTGMYWYVLVCTGMYWYVLVFDGTCLLGWDAQEWIGSLARRGICLLHLVDEEVGFLVWLCPVSHAESMNSASAETWNQKWPSCG